MDLSLDSAPKSNSNMLEEEGEIEALPQATKSHTESIVAGTCTAE